MVEIAREVEIVMSARVVIVMPVHTVETGKMTGKMVIVGKEGAMIEGRGMIEDGGMTYGE